MQWDPWLYNWSKPLLGGKYMVEGEKEWVEGMRESQFVYDVDVSIRLEADQ